MRSYPYRILNAAILGFLLLAGTLVYWQVVKAPQILARADNPRHYEAKRREERGRILDHNGHTLVESEPGDDGSVRRYRYPPLVHVTGYDSLRYGSNGIEARYDHSLRGTAGRNDFALWLDGVLHRQPPPHDVKLTIVLEAQRAADEALGSRRGAVVVLESDTGRIVALASHPYFDPNRLEDKWHLFNNDSEQPFLNRVTQGLYSPGPVFTLATLAAALDREVTNADETFPDAPPDLSWAVDLWPSGAHPPPYPVDLRSALASSHLTVFVTLGFRLGSESLLESYERFALRDAVPLEIQTVQPYLPQPESLNTRELALLATGQGALYVSPLHLALIAAAISRDDGAIPMPHLVESVLSPDGSLVYRTEASVLSRPIRPQTAAQVRQLLPAWSRLMGQTGAVELGPGIKPHAVFVGFASLPEARYTICALIENEGRGEHQSYELADRVLQSLLHGR